MHSLAAGPKNEQPPISSYSELGHEHRTNPSPPFHPCKIGKGEIPCKNACVLFSKDITLPDDALLDKDALSGQS